MSSLIYLLANINSCAYDNNFLSICVLLKVWFLGRNLISKYQSEL
jgi:hypothetical protein